MFIKPLETCFITGISNLIINNNMFIIEIIHVLLTNWVTGLKKDVVSNKM